MFPWLELDGIVPNSYNRSMVNYLRRGCHAKERPPLDKCDLLTDITFSCIHGSSFLKLWMTLKQRRRTECNLSIKCSSLKQWKRYHSNLCLFLYVRNTYNLWNWNLERCWVFCESASHHRTTTTSPKPLSILTHRGALYAAENKCNLSSIEIPLSSYLYYAVGPIFLARRTSRSSGLSWRLPIWRCGVRSARNIIWGTRGETWR